MLLERVLAGGGYTQVCSTTDPGMVLEICRGFRPALLLLDLHMPEMDGFAVMRDLQELGADGRGPTIVVLTADATTAARREALSLGARDRRVPRLHHRRVSYHHERWDGTGYMAELKGDSIPLTGRITELADTFDSMTHDRPYHRAVAVDDAVAEIDRQAGRQFDPTLVDALMGLDHRALV